MAQGRIWATEVILGRFCSSVCQFTLSKSLKLPDDFETGSLQADTVFVLNPAEIFLFLLVSKAGFLFLLIKRKALATCTLVCIKIHGMSQSFCEGNRIIL